MSQKKADFLIHISLILIFSPLHPSSYDMTTSLEPVVLDAGKGDVRKISFVPGYELIAIASDGSKEIRVFSYRTFQKPKHILKDHLKTICGITHLFDDVIASLDRSGKIITWHTSTGKLTSVLWAGSGSMLSQWQNTFYDLAITQDNKLLVFSRKRFERTIGVITHSEGRNLEEVTRWKTNNNHNLIAVHRNICVTFKRHGG